MMKGLVLAIPLMGMVTTSYITGAKIKQDKLLMRKLMLVGLILLGSSMVTVAFFKQIYVIGWVINLRKYRDGFAAALFKYIDNRGRGQI